MKRKPKEAKNERRHRLKEKEAVKRGFASLVAVQVQGDDKLTIGLRSGLYGSINSVGLSIPHEQLVGAVENTEEMGPVVIKVGILALAHLLGYNLAYGIDGLAKAACKFANIDVAGLVKEMSEDDMKRYLQKIEQDKLEKERWDSMTQEERDRETILDDGYTQEQLSEGQIEG